MFLITVHAFALIRIAEILDLAEKRPHQLAFPLRNTRRALVLVISAVLNVISQQVTRSFEVRFQIDDLHFPASAIGMASGGGNARRDTARNRR